MKKFLVFVPILFLGCSNSKPKKYVERIDYTETPGDYYPPYEIDTIEAYTDKMAYEFAIQDCYLELIANINLHKGISVKSFSVKTASGVSLEKTLPKSVRDSIRVISRVRFAKYSINRGENATLFPINSNY